MVKYIQINRYTSGNIMDEVDKVIEAGLMDEYTRLFFNKHACITTQDLAELIPYFDITVDVNFDGNVVFIPKERMYRGINHA